MALVSAEPTGSSVAGRVLGPIGRSIVDRLSSTIGHQSEADVRLALDRAGLVDTDPRTYLYQQVVFAIVGLVVGVIAGGLAGTRVAVLMGGFGLVLGASMKRSELARLTKRRCAVIRSELTTINAILAVRAQATPNLQYVLRQVVDRGRGEVVGELSRVLAAIESGVTPDEAFAAAAIATPEPAAGRLYRLLADKVRSGGDIASALIGQASDIREAGRDGRRATATQRKVTMMVTTVLFMAPTMVLFIAAPLPSLVLHH